MGNRRSASVVLYLAFHDQFCVTNFISSLEIGRKEVIGMILQQYLIRILLPFYYNQPQWHVSEKFNSRVQKEVLNCRISQVCMVMGRWIRQIAHLET